MYRSTPSSPRDLKLDYPDESRASSRRLQIPHEECCGQVRSAARIDEAHIGTRRHLEPQCRVQIPVGSRRPPPDGVLGQLTIWLLVQHTAADVSACLCIEQADRGGVGRLRSLVRWFGQSRLEHLRLDHAAGHRVRTPKLTGDSPKADQSRREDNTLIETHESLVFLPWLVVDHRPPTRAAPRAVARVHASVRANPGWPAWNAGDRLPQVWNYRPRRALIGSWPESLRP